MRGSIGWLKRRNFASSGQSLLRDKQDERSYRVCRATNRKIGGLPIGVKLEGRLRIPSAILGGGGIEIRSRGPSRDPSGRRAQTGQSRKAFSDAGPMVRILLPPAASQVRTRIVKSPADLQICRSTYAQGGATEAGYRRGDKKIFKIHPGSAEPSREPGVERGKTGGLAVEKGEQRLESCLPIGSGLPADHLRPAEPI